MHMQALVWTCISIYRQLNQPSTAMASGENESYCYLEYARELVKYSPRPIAVWRPGRLLEFSLISVNLIKPWIQWIMSNEACQVG